jgi:hypothetical protein
VFLGCQKIDYHAKHCNIARKKGFRKTLPSLEIAVHVVAERELIIENCEWKKKKKKKEEEELVYYFPEISLLYTLRSVFPSFSLSFFLSVYLS